MCLTPPPRLNEARAEVPLEANHLFKHLIKALEKTQVLVLILGLILPPPPPPSWEAAAPRLHHAALGLLNPSS